MDQVGESCTEAFARYAGITTFAAWIMLDSGEAAEKYGNWMADLYKNGTLAQQAQQKSSDQPLA